MAFRAEKERSWRRSDKGVDGRNRTGSSGRKMGDGQRSTPGGDTRRGSTGRTPIAGDSSNPPDYWSYRQAWMQPGPDTGYGPQGYRRADDRIQEDIRDRLTQHAEINADEIEVEVLNGAVTLTGIVEDKKVKRLAEANVDMIPGVVSVNNELELRNKPTREEEAAEKTAAEMAEKFPGGPTPTGNGTP